MAGRFLGKVAFVTGAASGIGRETASCFAAEGARVMLADISEELGREAVADIDAKGGEARFVRCDVTRATEVEAAIAATIAAFGRLDCAFNNAGNNSPYFHVHEYPDEVFENLMRVHACGMFYCTKYEISHMLGHGGGTIVNTASAAGLRGSRMRIGYNAAKHAVIGLTKSAALDGAASGIRVNAVCPGLIETPMTIADLGDVDAEARRTHPIGRVGTPREVADLVLFLCSDAASFITGAAVSIDGGWTSG